MASAYEMLAADYDWMFNDDELANGRAINLPATARLLQRIRRTSTVLDAACGTGVDAAVLARRGFTVWAADGSDAMIGGATARFRRERLARRGGYVVIDSRNWEKLHAERLIVQVADKVVIRGGRRCVVLYAWEVPDRIGDEHLAHLMFVFENGDQIEPHEHQITFHPFTVSELRERLELAGLREIDTDFDDSRDRYAVVSVAT
jgi:SAM-dependent methyltransferase